MGQAEIPQRSRLPPYFTACYPLSGAGAAPNPIQNNSGLPQGPAGASTASSACGKLAQRVPDEPMVHATRRQLITLLCGAAAWPLAAGAQQRERIRRIGVLQAINEGDSEAHLRKVAFVGGLHKLGWTE